MIHYPSLRQQIYAFVRDQLQQGLLAPGERICLPTLSRHLGVSKTPLRDALIQLETDSTTCLSTCPTTGPSNGSSSP